MEVVVDEGVGVHDSTWTVATYICSMAVVFFVEPLVQRGQIG